MNKEKQSGVTQNRFKTNISKLVAGLLTLIVMAASFSGCNNVFSKLGRDSGSNVDANGEVMTTRRPTQTTAFETNALSEIEQKMVLAPDIDGAVKVVKEIDGYQRVTYERDGVYIGEFKKEVFFEGVEVGGVAMIPSDVEKLLNKSLAEIPEGQEKWKLFVPADISEFKNKDAKITIERVDDPLGNKDVFLKVGFDGENVSVSNPIMLTPEGRGFTNTRESSIIPDAPVGIGIYGFSDEVNRQEWMTVMGKFEFSEKIMGSYVPFGNKVTETKDPIVIYIGSKNGAPSINNNGILKIGDSVVFVIDI